MRKNKKLTQIVAGCLVAGSLGLGGCSEYGRAFSRGLAERSVVVGVEESIKKEINPNAYPQQENKREDVDEYRIKDRRMSSIPELMREQWMNESGIHIRSKKDIPSLTEEQTNEIGGLVKQGKYEDAERLTRVYKELNVSRGLTRFVWVEYDENIRLLRKDKYEKLLKEGKKVKFIEEETFE